MTTNTEKMNISNPYYNVDRDKINVEKPCSLHEVDSTIGICNECQSNNENDDSIDRNEADFIGENETELVSSFEEEVETENRHFSFFLETDNRLGSNGNDKVPPCSCSCSSSSSSTTSTLNSSSSTGNNSRDIDGTNKDDHVDNTLEGKRNTGQAIFVRSVFKDIPEFAIARSRIAAEAANEALRRKGLNRSKLDTDTHQYTITSVGRGSSAANIIHQKDERPLWQQGCDTERDNDGDGSDESIGNNDSKNGSKMDFDFPIMSIAEQAAAMGLLKQQQRNGKNEKPENKCSNSTIAKQTEMSSRSADDDSNSVTMDINSETQIKLFDRNGNITGTTSVTMRVFITTAMVLGRLSWKLKRIRSNNAPESHEE